MKRIIRNSVSLCWGTPVHEQKYVGDDTFDVDAGGFLAAARFHVYSVEAAGSVLFEEQPAILTDGLSDVPVSKMPFGNIQVTLPVRHGCYGTSIVVDYVGDWMLSSHATTYRPCEHLRIFVRGDHVSHCVITQLDCFDWQTDAGSIVVLSNLSAKQRQFIIRRLVHGWLYEDFEQEMVAILTRWEQQHRSDIFLSLPESAQSALLEQAANWTELLDANEP